MQTLKIGDNVRSNETHDLGVIEDTIIDHLTKTEFYVVQFGNPDDYGLYAAKDLTHVVLF